LNSTEHNNLASWQIMTYPSTQYVIYACSPYSSHPLRLFRYITIKWGTMDAANLCLLWCI